MNPGDCITLVWPARRTLEHGVVVGAVSASAVVAVKLRDVPFDKIGLYPSRDDENVTWVHGWLRWWWPPDRQRRRALQVAYALSGTRIEMKVRTAGHGGFVTDADKLVDDFNKVFLDLQGVVEGVERSLKK